MRSHCPHIPADSDELPLPNPAAKVDRLSEIAPVGIRPVAAPENSASTSPSAVEAPLPAHGAEQNGSSKGPAPVEPPETTTGAAIAVQSAGASAPSAPKDDLPPLLRVELERRSREAAVQIASAALEVATSETKITSAIMHELPGTTAGSIPAELQSRVPAADADPSNLGASPRPPILSPQEREGAEKMVARGERHLAEGNVASARQFFLRAATAGLARGALLLAATYDPRELVRLGVHGVQPSLPVARKWYERAHELGATEAEARLAQLAGAD
jgi:hypothetical protein